MKSKRMGSRILGLALTVALSGLQAFAQNASTNQNGNNNVKTDSRMLYHNGEVIHLTPKVYIVWYGVWGADIATQLILADFISGIGSTPYFQINSTYPDGSGRTPNGATIYAGACLDQYSHGVELTASDIQGIVADQILGNGLPLDPSAIYLVFASPDVSSTATGFCIPNAPPHHGYGVVNGSTFRYGFVGHAMRCPSLSGMIGQPTPNGNSAADAMASTLAHVLNAIVTDPLGNAWFDRYGLENADKCAGTYGQTYLTANGARANMRLGRRDFLIQQNWVNGRQGRCALSQ
jgi:Phosphate-induced protein 1 conserved region